MQLTYDPGDGARFCEAISRVPGYPAGETMPIRQMLVESGALYRLPEILESLKADPREPVLIVMDGTPMQRGPDSLKPLVQSVLAGGSKRWCWSRTALDRCTRTCRTLRLCGRGCAEGARWFQSVRAHSLRDVTSGERGRRGTPHARPGRARPGRRCGIGQRRTGVRAIMPDIRLAR
jgi:hypothetical protein